LRTDRDGANAMKETVLDNDFWSQVRYVLLFSKPSYNMIQFVDSYQPVIGEVYEQMDTMLGHIKDIVQPSDVNMYNHIRIEVEKTVGKTKYSTTSLSICAYTKILSYITA
jgi:hypothetical protein